MGSSPSFMSSVTLLHFLLTYMRQADCQNFSLNLAPVTSGRLCGREYCGRARDWKFDDLKRSWGDISVPRALRPDLAFALLDDAGTFWLGESGGREAFSGWVAPVDTVSRAVVDSMLGGGAVC